MMLSPDQIIKYGVGLRAKLTRLRETIGYKTFKPLQDVFSIADDLCELIVALAENQKEWLADQQAQHGSVDTALNPPPDLRESKGD